MEGATQIKPFDIWAAHWETLTSYWALFFKYGEIRLPLRAEECHSTVSPQIHVPQSTIEPQSWMKHSLRCFYWLPQSGKHLSCLTGACLWSHWPFKSLEGRLDLFTSRSVYCCLTLGFAVSLFLLILDMKPNIISSFKKHMYIYIYIYAFSRRFYPKRLTLHSS